MHCERGRKHGPLIGKNFAVHCKFITAVFCGRKLRILIQKQIVNMAPKVPEKQQLQQHSQGDQQRLNNNSVVIKHSNPFHISAFTLCHNKRLKQKRSKYAEYLRNVNRNSRCQPPQTPPLPPQQPKNHKTEVRRQILSLLQADVTIDLLSDDEEDNSKHNQNVQITDKPSVIVYPERMCLERAALLGLMPVDRTQVVAPTKQQALQPLQPMVPVLKTQHQQITNGTNIPPEIFIQQQQEQQQPLSQPLLMVPIHKLTLPQTQPRKRKSRPQKRKSLPEPPTAPILLNTESIVLSDDSSDALPVETVLRHQTPELSVTCPTSSQIPCLPQQTTMQVDEEVTISLVPRSLTASCVSGSSYVQNSSGSSTMASSQEVFPMLPDETTVHTVIANRIYELSLTKLREGLASCGIPEFADGQQKISPQRRKGLIHQPPMVSPPQAPISLKLSSDLSISLISDDDEDESRLRSRQHEPILSPAFLQKLPVNVSIAPVPMGPPANHTAEPRKLKLG